MLDASIFATWWFWLCLGFAILALDIFVTSTDFLLYLGCAAIVTGVLAPLLLPSWEYCLLCFSVLSVIFSLLWWKFLRVRGLDKSAQGLNSPEERMLGKKGMVTSTVSVGSPGRITLGDSSWLAVSEQEIPAGSAAVVIAVEGSSLRVELLQG